MSVELFAWNKRSARSWQDAASAPRFVTCGVGVAWMLVVSCVLAAEPPDTGTLLKRAYALRTLDHPEFALTLKSLEQRSAQLTAAERESLHYLLGWESVYAGDYAKAISQLQAVIGQAGDATLRFRAAVTLVNVLTLADRYEEAFSQLSWVLAHLSEPADEDVRALGMLSAALLYNEASQYELGLSYAQRVIDGHDSAESICKAGQFKLEALSRSGKLQAASGEFQVGIDNCLKVGESLWANIIRTYQAGAYIRERHFDEAARLLSEHYEETRNTHYPRLISAFDALLAEAYRRKGAVALARHHALGTIDGAVKNAFTEPLVTAYRVLYEIAREQGDLQAALAFHEKYTAADKGYLDAAGVRRLAYQKAIHEKYSNQLQLDALTKENRALHLQRQLAGKAVETSRLYIAMLSLAVAFIVLWAYMTRRSQLRFRCLSQLDGLTGICNRPHFIQQADRVLASGRHSGEEVCVILCDLDHFKVINDRHGHATGDFVLKRTVAVFNSQLRASDIFARVGGEEFAILLPGCDVEEARRRAEQLRSAIAATNVYRGTVRASISASFGVATSSWSGYELRQLMAHADAALYHAKRAGRNRVVLYDAMDDVGGLVAATAIEAMPGSERSFLAT